MYCKMSEDFNRSTIAMHEAGVKMVIDLIKLTGKTVNYINSWSFGLISWRSLRVLNVYKSEVNTKTKLRAKSKNVQFLYLSDLICLDKINVYWLRTYFTSVREIRRFLFIKFSFKWSCFNSELKFPYPTKWRVEVWTKIPPSFTPLVYCHAQWTPFY